MALSATSPELGNLVFFDHINLQVTDHRLATLFYIEGLGLTRDPYRNVGARNMWVNVGTQQFHLPVGYPPRFAGEIGVAVPDSRELEERLKAVRDSLAGTAFAFSREPAPGPDTVRVIDPWGRLYRAYQASVLPGRNPLAIPYIEFWVAPGTHEGIARFYREVVGAPVETVDAGGEPAAHVFAGPHQALRFREKRGEAPSGHALHVALYLTRFWEVYARMEGLGIVCEAARNEQFRFMDIPAGDGRGLLYSIEHEMRSVYHPDYRRPLVNRVAMPNEPGHGPRA
jgi:hypothetical protein